MNILEGHFKEKVVITDQKFYAGYYIVEFNTTEDFEEDDYSVLRLIGCKKEVEREIAYEEALKAYKELEKNILLS